MAQTTAEECLVFLKEAKEELEGTQALASEERVLEEKERQLGRAWETEKKRMNDMVQQTVKQRRNEIHTNYDRELFKVQDQLKKVRAKREKAKNQGVRERIADETAGLISEIRGLKVQFCSLARQRHLPFYCRTNLYYSLYFPRHPKEFLTFLAFVLVMFLAIPGGIYLCIPQRRLWHLGCIYAADLLVAGGVFLHIGNHSKLLYMESLRDCRALLDKMYADRRKIRRVTRAIRKDRNESHYNLGKFDDDISRLQKELQDVAAKKKEALDTYERVTKVILTDEIENNHKDRLEKLRQEHEQARMGLDVVRQELKQKRLRIMDHYGAYLGKDFMDPAKVARLCLIVQEGRASNVSEAIEKYYENGDSVYPGGSGVTF